MMLSHANVSRAMACFEHSNFFKVTGLVEGALHGAGWRPRTGFSPSVTSCSKELRPQPTPKHLLIITPRAPGEPDFKFELLPLHSPLLGQSLLVSFPPLIDMLKFSGYVDGSTFRYTTFDRL